MAKSLRSKTKRSYRATKREKGVYAVTEAARLHRLNAKLQSTIASSVTATDDDQQNNEDDFLEGSDEPSTSGQRQQQNSGEQTPADSSMDVDQQAGAQKVSTHGPRTSRRQAWRVSKGLAAFPKSNGINRQGGVAAKRKAGRSKRRR